MKTKQNELVLSIPVIQTYSSLEEAIAAGKQHNLPMSDTKQLPMTSHNILKIQSGFKTQTRRIATRNISPGIYWLREQAQYVYFEEDTHAIVRYRLDGQYSGLIESLKPTNPKTSMARGIPKAFARLFINVFDVQNERLQDISVEDAIAEGINLYSNDPISDFIDLWDSIYGKKPGCDWISNPNVKVLKFDLL